ncbi:hypothetical protein AB395_0000211 [Sinorhizobium fredii CCBAU 45436]|nr:hypothetical protein AB395_0000211 [Sinorhizobium fredii CCBAU 45436]AWM23541.1 hypothetical protein AOX55_0000258 [Sinorhizobium fredii CCBAU 25509]
MPEARQVPTIARHAGDGAHALTKDFEERLRRLRSRCQACTPYDFNSHV